jgi:3,4-dihydroxy 2-butanone 4-phosphate synthase/GTP cyclohydrolase II
MFQLRTFKSEQEAREGRMKLNTVEELLEDIRAGKMVILMDDEDRENEGDLIMAGQACQAEHINFMARYGRGLICMPMSLEHCERLNLPLMVQRNNSGFGTKFTVSIEAAVGVSTGISAADRARTVQAAAAPGAVAEDIVSPGHIFPLMAQPGGVLARAGHTEAACDLARMAGFGESGVICEIMNDDGSMSRRPQLEAFAREHNLKIGTIADLIHYRLLNERTVKRVSEQPLETELGSFNLVTYRDSLEGAVHLALTLGKLEPEEPTLVRVHNMDPLRDLFMVNQPGRWSLRAAMSKLAEEGHGVVLLLGNQMGSEELLHHVNQLAGTDAPEREPTTYNTVGAGSQILRDLGVRKMRLLSKPMKFNAISGFDLEVVEYLPCN